MTLLLELPSFLGLGMPLASGRRSVEFGSDWKNRSHRSAYIPGLGLGPGHRRHYIAWRKCEPFRRTVGRRDGLTIGRRRGDDMLIKIRRSWEIPERMATPEALVLDRRGLLKSAGALALAGALSNCGPASNTQTATSGGGGGGSGGEGPHAPEPPDPTHSLYPARRNPAYTLDRALTPEVIVTSYNNYYEFGTE